MADRGRKGAEATARKWKGKGLDPDELPALDGPQAAAQWLQVIGRAVATGRLGHREGATVVRAVEAFLKAHDAGDIADQVGQIRAALDTFKKTGDASPLRRLK